MNQRGAWLLLFTWLAGGCASDIDEVGTSTEALVITDRCDITGSGSVDGGDTFDGEVRGGDTTAIGDWLHVSSTEGPIELTADTILCRLNGARLGDFSGSATFGGAPGYTFGLHVQDRGNPDEGTWEEGEASTRTLTASWTAPRVRWVRGRRGHLRAEREPGFSTDDALEERLFVTVPAELPITSGTAGEDDVVTLTFTPPEGDAVTCTYTAPAEESDPHHHHRHHRHGFWRHGFWHHGFWHHGFWDRGDEDDADHYVLDACSGGPEPVEAGSRIEASTVVLHVAGDEQGGACRGGDVTVEVVLDVSTEVFVYSDPDYYRLSVWDAGGERIFFHDGYVTTGDIHIEQFD